MSTNTYNNKPITDFVLCEVPDLGYDSISLQTQPVLLVNDCAYAYARSVADLLNEAIRSDTVMTSTPSDPDKVIEVFHLRQLVEFMDQDPRVNDAFSFVRNWTNRNRRSVLCDEREYSDPSLYCAHLANLARVHMPESL